MTIRKLPILAAALLLSCASIGTASADPITQNGTSANNPQSAGSGASNSPSHQPAGTVMGSGGTPTGTSTGNNGGNRDANADSGMGHAMPAAYHHMSHHHMMRHHMMRHHRRHHPMMHHTTAMGGGGGAMTPAGDGVLPTGGGGMGRSTVHNSNGVGVGSMSITGPANRSTTNSGDTGSATQGGPNGAKPSGH